MPRGYRNAIIAAVGIVILATLFSTAAFILFRPASPNLVGEVRYQAQERQRETAVTDCQPTALKILEPKQAEARKNTCTDAAELHRYNASNLIEYRRAADAAEASARFSYDQARVSVLGVVLGIATMAAAVIAAVFAGMAAYGTSRGAKATEASLKHAKLVSRHEQRPWIRIDVEEASLFSDTLMPPVITCSVVLTNIGRSVAKVVNVEMKIFSGADASRSNIDTYLSCPIEGEVYFAPRYIIPNGSGGFDKRERVPEADAGIRTHFPIAALKCSYRGRGKRVYMIGSTFVLHDAKGVTRTNHLGKIYFESILPVHAGNQDYAE
jgi:hypothetical protein